VCGVKGKQRDPLWPYLFNPFEAFDADLQKLISNTIENTNQYILTKSSNEEADLSKWNAEDFKVEENLFDIIQTPPHTYSISLSMGVKRSYGKFPQ
jgi:hypothetical protein